MLAQVMEAWQQPSWRANHRALQFTGIDTLVRDDSHIPVESFDGVKIPRHDNSTDYVLFSDVLHHTEVNDAFSAKL